LTNLEVSLYEDAASFSAIAGEFLRSRPVHHNLILTLLDGRATGPEPGRYWVSVRAGQVAGAVIQTDPARFALVVPMNDEETGALVDAIAAAGVVFPGVFGDAAAAASFAGLWTGRSKSAAIPTQGSRPYELAELKGIASVEGKLRRAEEADRKLVEIWVCEYQVETHDLQGDAARQTDGWLTSLMRASISCVPSSRRTGLRGRRAWWQDWPAAPPASACSRTKPGPQPQPEVAPSIQKKRAGPGGIQVAGGQAIMSPVRVRAQIQAQSRKRCLRKSFRIS
jgi:hypothetical protein